VTDIPEESPLAQAALAFRMGELRVAIAAYDRALSSGNSAASPADRGAALLGRALAHQLLGELSAAFADVIAALDTWRVAPADWLAITLTEIASALTPESQQLAAEYWSAARQLAQRSGDGRLTAIVVGEQGRQLALAGDAERARALFGEAEELARRAGDDQAAAAALVNLARIDLEAGRSGDAARSVAEALAIAGTGSHVDAAAGVLIDIAVHAFKAGQPAEAELYLEQVLALGDVVDPLLHERALTALAGVARERRDLPRALRLGDEVVDLLKAGGDSTAAAEVLHDLGVTALAAARGDDAEDKLIDSLMGARRYHLASLGSAASRALALLASRRGNHLRALGYAEQAAAFATGNLEREASALTLAMVASEAERWQRYEICAAAHAGAVEIYRSLGRDDLAANHERAQRAAEDAVAAEIERRRSVEQSVQLARDIVGPDA
jgi:tetratricopeptide (TPR) repeat protein